MTTECFAVIAGGGTLGHLTPGMAVARELVDRGHASETIHFVGSSRGVEATEVPEAGFSLTLLPGRGIQRRLTLENFGAVFGILRGIVQSVGLLRRLRPKVVLSTGGYASVACVTAAVIWRIPVVVAESNAVAGSANRMASRFARASAVAFASADLKNQTVTGNPVRADMLAMARNEDPERKQDARKAIGAQVDGPLLSVFGGSLGARRINETVIAVSAERPEMRVHHVIGHRDWKLFEADLASAGRVNPGYRAVEFEHHMDQVLAASDLVLSRSGATSVAEIAAIGVASILVPLPIATADHQTANARVLTDVGAARIIPDKDLDVERLTGVLDELLWAEASLAEMAKAASSVAHLDAAAQVADLVEEHAAQ
jgi:UDP-N-acetylglucosamine--N-acetylmuramyl-(pentapeptide) pyrophosphoryl-undecaprenol N-acetylglucosamine transferase